MKVLIAALALALVAPVSAHAASTDVATLTVSGDGAVERAPELARLSVTIITNDDRASVSTSKNNDIYNALKSRLAALGLNDAARTTGYAVNFVPRPLPGAPPEQQSPRYGYVTNRQMYVVIVPLDLVGKVIDEATAAGVTNIGSLNFDIRDRKSAFDDALAVAMADAKKTAEILARAGGFELVRLESVEMPTSNGQFVTIARVTSIGNAYSPGPTPTTIEANGPITISAHVTVKYVIRQP